MPDTVASLAIEHILREFSTWNAVNSFSPLFVGLQGPQGIGKTTLAHAIVTGLGSAPHSLRVVMLSIDDLYLEHEKLQTVSRAHPGNPLLQGRGMPGTHDVGLGRSILRDLSSMRRASIEDTAECVSIPSYDKSLHSGLGDRLPREDWTRIRPPVDVVVMEGWCLGFYPAPLDILLERWARRTELGMPDSVQLENGLDDIKVVTENLKRYVEAWYSFFSCFIQVTPASTERFETIYKWRLQQEHTMKAKNGGRGMSDEQVARFVGRYIPGYIFFDGPSAHTGDRDLQPWHGKGLKITVNEGRIPVRTGTF